MLQYCSQLKAMSHADRHETVKQLRCCFNCLLLGHSIKACARGNCQKCGKKHHTLLHIENVVPNSADSAQPSTSAVARDAPSERCVSNTASLSSNYTVSSMAVVLLEDSQGNVHECRALLDIGSQAHFITESFCKDFGITHTTVNANVIGLGRWGNSIHSRARVTLKSRCNSFRADLSCFVIKDITDDMPNVPLDRMSIPIPAGITLADPHFAKLGRVDLLISAALFWQLLCVGQHRIASGDLVWHKTRLGWILGGQLSGNLGNKTKDSNVCHAVSNEGLQHAISQFWEIKNHNSTHQHITKVDDCERHFSDTTTRDAQGRYVVSIPFNDKVTELDQVQKLKRELIQILDQAGFSLRNWASNDSCALGASSDELHYAVRRDLSARISKRVILSEIAQIFDPLGLIGPVVTKAKLVMQQLWHWRHVVSSDNPADIISRGISPDKLINNSLWWVGPPWLSQMAKQRPYLHYAPPENLPEQRQAKVVCIGATKNEPSNNSVLPEVHQQHIKQGSKPGNSRT
ncbi:uncharacterized protein LOC143374874 [Andrena cerasifolii]|uniref:uncharacterized protein LOC143374874 n=1 Tax=Andrena cerasifolii TaxID=2819439 RepID=UPI004037AA5D